MMLRLITACFALATMIVLTGCADQARQGWGDNRALVVIQQGNIVNPGSLKDVVMEQDGYAAGQALTPAAQDLEALLSELPGLSYTLTYTNSGDTAVDTSGTADTDARGDSQTDQSPQSDLTVDTSMVP